MSQQIQITGGAKVRSLEGVITGTTGVLNSLPINGSLGIPQLDVNGKILVSQLPNSVMEYLGTWDASTNTPTLVNGTGNAGDVYLCNVAGTVNFGAGPISFVVSDQVIYSGSIWQKASGTSGTVTSVAASITGNSLGITGSPITTAGTLAFAFGGTNLQYVNGAGNLTTFPTLISSIGLSMPSAFSVSNSPLTANGTIAVAGAGTTAQYIRGDGTLATFPAVGGGGGGLSFYLNGGTSQGTISGNTYYQMSPNAIIDTGVDFSRGTDGVIGYFLTDVSSPNQLKIPAGNWNFELYFSASSNGGSPSFYVEVFKYNTGVFTLIGSSVATPEGITNGTAIDLYVTAVSIPTTTLIVSDRIALRITVSTSGRTITLHTQGTHLCEVLTTFPSGITALNGLTIGTQYFATGTSGSDFNIASVLDTHTFNIPDAGASARGVMTTGTQTIAGAKTFSGNLTANSFIKIGGGNLEFLKADGSVDSTAYVQSVTATSPLVRTGATNTPILSIPAATSSVNGYLTSTDWTTFNNKTSASGTASQIAYFTGANSLASDSFLWWDESLNRIGIGDFSTITPPAALSMISTIGAWYNRNTANPGNYSEIGLYYDGATYGHLIQSNKVGTTDYSRISFINNAQTSLVLAEDYTVGINTRTPIPNISGVGGQGLDIYGGSVAASLAFHNVATGSTITDGSRLYITTAKHLLLRNLETANVSIIADDGNVYINAGGFDRITALSTGNVGIMNPATITQALTVNGNVLATSYITSGGTSSQFVKGNGSLDSNTYLTTSSASSTYVPLTRTITINGSNLDLSTNIVFNVGTVTGSGSGSSTRVAFWNGVNNITNSANLYWDNTNSRLGINKGAPTSSLDVVGTGNFYQGSLSIDTVAVSLTGQVDQSFSGTESNQYALIGMSGVYYSYPESNFTPNAASAHCGSAATIFKENTGGFLGHLSSYTSSANIAGTGNITILSGYRVNTPRYWSGHTLFTGTIATSAGLYIDDLRGQSTINARTTSSWGIYQTGTGDNNYFAGKVLIGTNTVSTYALDVTGTGRFSGSVTAGAFLRASSGAQSNPTGGGSVVIDYQSTSDLQGRIRSRDWDGATWKNLTLEANNIILSPTGNVGIGTTLPSGIVNGKALVVYDTNYPRLILQNSTTGTGTGAYSGLWMEANDMYVQNSQATGKINFGVNSSSQAMTITSGGNVIVGGTGTYFVGIYPNSGTNTSIELNGGAGSNSVGTAAYIQLIDRVSSGNRQWLWQIDGSSQYATWYNNGISWTKVGYQTTGGTWTNSDERRKENISLSTYGLNQVLQLIPKTFNFKNDERKIKDIGFIAQDVLNIIPDAVRTDMDGETEYYAMNYSNLIPVLVKAIQEMNTKFEEQQATITSLQEQINELKNK